MATLLEQAQSALRGSDGKLCETLCRRMLAEQPEHFAALSLCGEALLTQKKYREAESTFRQALAKRPDSAETLIRLARALMALQRGPEAVELLRQTLRLQPAHGEALTSLGITLANLGRKAESLQHWRQAAQVRPEFAPIHHNLGVALAEQGEPRQAAAALAEALRLNPNYAEAYYNLGNVYRELNDCDQAMQCYRKALALRPRYGEALNNLGLTLTEAGHYGEAAIFLQQAIRLRPEAGEGHLNLGLALVEVPRFAEAEASYQAALRCDPGYVEAHNNLGSCLKAQGRLEEALASYQLGLWLDPTAASTRYNRSLTLLQAGNYAEGWAEYEWRWRRNGQRERHAPWQRWDGKDLAGKTILLWCEQGLGDAIQFIRYAPLVQGMGGRVIVECPPPLQGLFATCAGIDQVVALGEPLPEFAVHAPLLSLPGLLGTILATVPATIPYLKTEPERIAAWRQQLGKSSSPRVGLVWQGNPRHPWDRWRSMPVTALLPLLEVPGVQFVSLQHGHGSEQLGALPSHLPILELPDAKDEGDFRDTAAILKNLDLLITVDTAVAHLAGAVEVPTWVAVSALPDWRWLLDRADTPWYPTLQLYRQKQLRDWSEVVANMRADLRQWVLRHGESGQE